MYIWKLSFCKIFFFEVLSKFINFLLEKIKIIPDQSFINSIYTKKDPQRFKYLHYLYSGIKPFIDYESQKKIEKQISSRFNENIDVFAEKCRLGENGTYICSLIREDSIDEFVSYVTRMNISLNDPIQPSIYETNSFLMNSKKVSLIEYAAFYENEQC